MVAGPGFTPRTHPPRPVLSGNTVPLFILLPPFFLQLRKQRQKEVKGLKLAAGLPTPEPWLNQAASIFEPWLPVLLSWEQKSLFTSSFVTLLFCDLGGVSHLPPPKPLVPSGTPSSTQVPWFCGCSASRRTRSCLVPQGRGSKLFQRHL